MFDLLSFLNNTTDVNYLLIELSLMIILATIFAFIARLIKQPLIPAYIIAGVILGPIGLKLISNLDVIDAMSNIGIVFLLFIVGLEIDINKLKKIKSVSTIGGSLQVVLTFFLGYLVSLLLGYGSGTAIIGGLIVAFSSTMVVIKLLSDKEEINTLHGRIMIGLLLVQDIWAVIAISLMKSFDSLSFSTLAVLLVSFLSLVVVAFLFNKFLVERIFVFAARSEEFLFLLSLTSCFIFVLLARMLDFSIAIGAFMGGLVLANLPYHYNIIGRISPLKDFFATLFFITLGMQLTLVNFKAILLPLVLFFILIFIAKPLIIMILLGLFGYSKRTAFLTGASLAQVSEFSLILVYEAKQILSPEMFSVVIFLVIITITLTSYVFNYENALYNFVSKKLSFIEDLSKRHKELDYRTIKRKKIILAGSHRMGTMILNSFKDKIDEFFVVDNNPEVVEDLHEKGVACMYGDITNLEVLKHLKLKQAKVLISTIPQLDDNLLLVSYARKVNHKLNIFIVANHLHEALELYEAGADYVIVPQVLSGERLSSILKRMFSQNKDVVKKLRDKHLKYLLDLS